MYITETKFFNYFRSVLIRKYNCNFLHILFLTDVKWMNEWKGSARCLPYLQACMQYFHWKSWVQNLSASLQCLNKCHESQISLFCLVSIKYYDIRTFFFRHCKIACKTFRAKYSLVLWQMMNKYLTCSLTLPHCGISGADAD